MARTLRVGIVGASAQRGWARISHVPAIQALPGLALGAVAGRDQRSADEAARVFGADAAYGDAAALLRDDTIDIVAIAVKVPDHRALVLAAAAAGKHIYCEWPVGRDVAETEALTLAVRAAGVHDAVGLQARANPAGEAVRELIEAGAIGRVLSARAVSTTMAFGPDVEPEMAFAEDPENGATLLTIQAAHTIDLAAAILGPIGSVAALLSTQYPGVTIGDGAVQRRVTPDHVLVQGRLPGGAPLCLEVAGGRAADAAAFHLEITGTRGVLELLGGAPRGFQSGRLRLRLNGQDREAPAGEGADLPDEAVNVAGIYAALRDDINAGTSTAPDFGHALSLARLVESLRTA